MALSLFNGSISASACSASTIPYLDLFGAKFLSLEANLVSNYSRIVPYEYYINHGAVDTTNLNFCNVSITYTHPGENDAVNVEVWLPTDKWNGRIQASGGDGWGAGLTPLSFGVMAGAIAEGYATLSTDAGLQTTNNPSVDVNAWALVSPGNVNLYLLQNLATVSLNDAAIIGKSVVRSFYGQPAKYSYFTGCSQGGRQGYALAQRYPDAYDGIAASAPAISWGELITAMYGPAFFMNQLGQAPHQCELNAITAAAIAACDDDDGVVDGVISDPEKCAFDAKTLVGTTINCTDTGTGKIEISAVAADVAQVVWNGLKKPDNTSSYWFGLNKEAPFFGLANTTCTANGTCTAVPFVVASDVSVGEFLIFRRLPVKMRLIYPKFETYLKKPLLTVSFSSGSNSSC
jgi:feruloyl esterase